MTSTNVTMSLDVPPLSVDGVLPRSVLLAEDEHLVAANLAAQLRSLGCELVGPVSNGSEAIDLAKRQTPDLALLDIRMPVMSGLEAAQVLFCQMSIPVVVLSAFSNAAFVEQGAKIGVFGYLLKPVGVDELRATLAVAWSRFRHQAQLRHETRELRDALEARKAIERAKGLLMQKLNLTEDQAMKRLQKQARDSRRKLADLARAVIETNELLGDAP